MDNRILDIIGVLDTDRFVTANDIADRLGVSDRTIRNIVTRARPFLVQHGLEIEAKTGAGYRLDVRDDQSYLELLERRGQRGTPQDSDARVRYLLELLLTAKGYVKVDDIAEGLFVSRSTLAWDLRKVDAILSEFGLLLDRKPYHGIKVVGAEVDVRHCLAASFQRLDEIVDSGDIPLARIVDQSLAAHDARVPDHIATSIVMHLAVAVKRVQSGNMISHRMDGVSRFVDPLELELADHLLGEVEGVAGLVFPAGEREYLALALTGKRVLGEGMESDREARAEANQLVHEMLTVLDDTYGFSLLGDEELRTSLAQHVMPLLIRLRFGINLVNPVLDQVKSAHPLPFVMASQAASVLTHSWPGDVTEDEVGYLAMWLALSLHRRRPTVVPKHVLLVSGAGAGSAQLLGFTVQERFGDLLASIETTVAHRVADEDLAEVDLILTTVPLQGLDSRVPVEVISDFLDESEATRVRRLLTESPVVSIERYLSPHLFLPHLRGTTRGEVIDELTARCREVHDLPELFAESVHRREALSSTDFGNFVAMPHAEVAMSPETFVCVGILDRPITWERHEVQVVFLVCLSSRGGQNMRSFYGTLSRYLMSPDAITRLVEHRSFDNLVRELNTIEKELEGIYV